MTTLRLERATTFDIVLSTILPFWGIIVGLIALTKGEPQRGRTMLIVSTIMLFVFVLWRFLTVPQ